MRVSMKKLSIIDVLVTEIKIKRIREVLEIPGIL